MTKAEFLECLGAGLWGLPRDETQKRIAFYDEMIDDRIEDGLSEEEAVDSIGDVQTVVSQIIAEIPLTKIVKEKITPKKKLNVFETVLLVLGSPIWLSLIIAAVAVAVSLYATVWAVIISCWAVCVAAAACVLVGGLGCFWLSFNGHVLTGLTALAAAFVCFGLLIFMFIGFKAATYGIILFTKKIILYTKKCLIKKEDA